MAFFLFGCMKCENDGNNLKVKGVYDENSRSTDRRKAL